MITLSTELAKIRGFGPQFLQKFQKLGINTVRDLLWYFPVRYEDYSRLITIAELEQGTQATVRVVIKDVSSRQSYRRRMTVIEARLADDTGEIRAVWFNQPYILRALAKGAVAQFSGKVSAGEDGLYFSNPSFEFASGRGTIHTGGLIPIYSETKGLTSKGIRAFLRPLLEVIKSVEDPIPTSVLHASKFEMRLGALRSIHAPQTLEEAERARERFAFEDLFFLQVHNILSRRALLKEYAPPLEYSGDDYALLLKTIPFALTGAQERSLKETLDDLAKPHPMNRLLQGDVGSGKTVIAMIAAILAARAGYQTAFMAPTEILARQHFATFEKVFGEALGHWNISNALLVGSLGEKEKRERKFAIEEGIAHIIIGTHALIEAPIVFQNLGFVVIDEQHRFGVDQRAKLSSNVNKKNETARRALPHFLSMSATPIPRTLMLSVFGDLDLSLIDELPKGRKPIITKIVASENRTKAYDFVRAQVKAGRQVFVICPRIEKSDPADAKEKKSGSGFFAFGQDVLWANVKAVEEEYARLAKTVFPDLRIAMLHGKLKPKEKEAVMSAFARAETDVLVATSVVEVGVDIPNATVMMIESAERFGLAQLYQFRGRIGRGEHQSYCFLFSESKGASTRARLSALLTAKNGFELAEKDLAIRGPGEFLGDKQTGLPDTAMEGLKNVALIKKARDAAELVVKNDPELTNHPTLLQTLGEFWKTVHLE